MGVCNSRKLLERARIEHASSSYSYGETFLRSTDFEVDSEVDSEVEGGIGLGV